MMNQQTLQDVTCRDDPIQYLSSPCTSIEEIDRMDLKDNLVSVCMRKPPAKVYRSLFPLLEVDWSSIWSHFEIKNETLLIEKLKMEPTLETFSEEDLVIEMLEVDFVVKMPPKKRYKIQAVVKSIKRGEPTRAVMSSDFFAIE